MNSMKIAVDFDGTIVEHRFPAIGKTRRFAFETLRELNKQGYKLILWTYRSGKELEEAVEFCKQNGVEFYAVNKNYPEEIYDGMMSRKIDADIYIDDKNIGGFIGWSQVWTLLNRGDKSFLENSDHKSKNTRSIFFGWFRKKK